MSGVDRSVGYSSGSSNPRSDFYDVNVHVAQILSRDCHRHQTVAATASRAIRVAMPGRYTSPYCLGLFTGLRQVAGRQGIN